MADFRERFNLLKFEKNLSLQEIAESVHLSIASLSKIVNGKQALKHDLVNELSNYFGVTKSYLIGETDNRYKDNSIGEDYIRVCEMAKELNVEADLIKKFLELVKDIRK